MPQLFVIVLLNDLVLYKTDFIIFYNTEGDVPLRILGLVGSLAVAFRKDDILNCLALWMSVCTSAPYIVTITI